MDVFKEIEKWKQEHREEWEKVEEYLKLLEEMGIKRGFKPEPLFPGFDFEYHYEVSGSANPSVKLKI